MSNKLHTRMGIIIAAGLACVVFAAGCVGYRLGTTLAPGIKTISVSTFVNQCGEPQIENDATSAAKKEFQKDGSLKLSSAEEADAILELRLYQLTGLERDKIEAEYLELIKLIEELRSILASEAKLLSIIKAELLEMRAKYSNPRKTEIIGAAGEFRMEDVIPNEGCVITVSHLGFIKRTRVADYRSQKRGGKGVIGAETYDEDFVEHLFTASTHDYILFLTSTGQCHAKKVYDVPEGTRTSKGKSVSSFLRPAEGEKIAAMVCVKDFAEDRYLVMATKRGVIKKSSLADYANCTRDGGLIGINLDEGDAVIGAVLTTGDNELILVSHQGLAVRLPRAQRQQGRLHGVQVFGGLLEERLAKAAQIEFHAVSFLTAGLSSWQDSLMAKPWRSPPTVCRGERA